ncbi:sigma-54-dependent transcriptional regulator [Stratiformator vulcanicus]|uniref:DNA-binding transcriptional regulator NtrC n=1 Tax=Stratiformator vulcanicus TaxID=2527980 RepID=A0A517QWZ0_9PLAN|nr:sigma-54 dependent transcriptional regulator [Stratiformator vulcanicus]QDT36088.1 Nitrogen regulation protein NR(I) [Stratiformator vulcanicus]
MSVFVFDIDEGVYRGIAYGLAQTGVEVRGTDDPEDGIKFVRREKPDVVLLDVEMSESKGLDIYSQIAEIDPRLPVVMMASDADSETAIEAMQLGAFDYVTKPLDLEPTLQLVQKAIRTRRMMSEPVVLPTKNALGAGPDQFVGQCPEMLEVFKSIGRVAKQPVSVLVRGESGTGKELVARAIYQHSERSDAPFVEINCAALPDTLLESELFGHEKGAFTSADRRRIGKFEQCNGGTVFLDEIGDMSPATQAKVLRLLQEQRFERVGGNETIRTDVRIIAATNRNLEKMVDKGTFREDLLYRLNGMTIVLPPLREREEDVPILLQYFLSKAANDLGRREIEGFSPGALRILKKYDWPGNLRQMQNIVRQSVVTASGPVIVADFLPSDLLTPNDERDDSGRPSESLDRSESNEMRESNLLSFVEDRLDGDAKDVYADAIAVAERIILTRVLQHTKGNQSEAARILGITRGKIRDRIAKFGITIGSSVEVEPAEMA